VEIENFSGMTSQVGHGKKSLMTKHKEGFTF